MVSAYCLDYNNWVCIPRHVKEDFKEMADMGYDAVCLTFCESEMAYARRTFEILVDMAHQEGLKVNVIPSRIGGRFAGAPLMPSLWAAQHPEYCIKGDYYWPVVCLESEAVRDWMKSFMKTLIMDYELDGIIWDEPKAPTLISYHPDTIRRFGGNPTEKDMAVGFCEFFDDLTAYCHKLNPKLVQTLFCIKGEREFFTERIAQNKEITYFGYDGNLSRQRRFNEAISDSKYRIESVWDRTLKECAQAGKKTFALVETMHMPREEHDNFEYNLNAYLENYHPDHLSLYYYAHNADDPEGLNEIIKRAMKKYIKNK